MAIGAGLAAAGIAGSMITRDSEDRGEDRPAPAEVWLRHRPGGDRPGLRTSGAPGEWIASLPYLDSCRIWSTHWLWRGSLSSCSSPSTAC